jgi:RNA polymerase sporulation-specific sigma factor
MFGGLFEFFLTKFLYLALHLDSGSFPRPLTPQEEIEAFTELRKGSLRARDDLIRHNLRLVAHIAKKYYAVPGDQEDLISIGTIGLIKAVNSFDSMRQARFSTYASKCIENEIRMQLRHGRKMPTTVSLQDSLETGRDGSELTVMDTIQDEARMEESCENSDEARRLHELIEHLNGRERQVILLRYGMAGQPPLTQQQVAKLLGISRSYVSRIETRALNELRRQKDEEEGSRA